MDVLVIVLVFVIAGIARGIIDHTVYIDDLMDQSVIQQTVQNAVNGYPVTQTVQLVLNSRLGQRNS